MKYKLLEEPKMIRVAPANAMRAADLQEQLAVMRAAEVAFIQAGSNSAELVSLEAQIAKIEGLLITLDPGPPS